MMGVAILGVGTVGSEVVNVLRANKTIITARAGVEISPVIGVVRDKTKARNLGAEFEISDDLDSVVKRDDINVFVELMGGVQKPYEIVKSLLLRKKPIVTANKALLAYHRYELQNLCRDVSFGYEASVAGGIPIIRALRDGLSANKIEKIVGILNGTSNYILTNMMKNDIKFKDALKQAQILGYAEADPTFDIGGFDAAHKLLILSSIAFCAEATPEDILIEGIENITADDIYFAGEFDYTIKLLAIAKKIDDAVEIRVHPALIDKNNMIAKVDGVMNGVAIFGDAMSESLYYGPGAGGKATASAVISDLIDVARGINKPMLGYKLTNLSAPRVLKSDEISTKYYLRLKVADEIGVLAKITRIMSENSISIDSFLQKSRTSSEQLPTLFFTTHRCKEANIKRASEILSRENFIKERPFMIRIEG